MHHLCYKPRCCLPRLRRREPGTVPHEPEHSASVCGVEALGGAPVLRGVVCASDVIWKQTGENAEAEIRQKQLATGKAGATGAAPRRFGTALSVNNNTNAPKAAPSGGKAPLNMASAAAPHLTAANRAEPTMRDNVMPGDIAGALDIDQADR